MTTPRYQVGQSWGPKADAFNAYGRVADWFSGTGGGNGPPTPRARPWQGDVRLILNDSGEDTEAGDVLAIDGVVVTPQDLELDDISDDIPPVITAREHFLRWAPQLALIGKKPDLEAPVSLNKHVGHFGVLLEPIPHDAVNPKFGLCVVSGIVCAPMDLVYQDHPFADLAHDTRLLKSNWYGSAEILYKQRLVDGVVDDEWESGPETITHYAVVRMSNFHTEELLVSVDELYGIAYGSSGDAKVYWGGALTDPLQTITIHFTRLGLGNTLANGTKADVRYNRSTQHWEVMGANCS